MHANVANQLFDLHTSLYQRAYSAAQMHASVNSPVLRDYAYHFQKMLPDSFQLTSESELIIAARNSDCVLYGDFHTLKQSQRGFLRLLRVLIPERKIVLALEMFHVEHQRYVEAFLAGNLAEQEFLETVQYQKTWGFPWDHYLPLLELAKANDIPVFAINISSKKAAAAKATRDHLMAQRIDQIRRDHPGALIVTMIGEYHTAEEYLPRQLKQIASMSAKNLKILKIVNNIDRYYFDLLKRSGNSLQSEFLKLKDDLYCIINTPAWMKWRSLAVWEEVQSFSEANQSYHADQDYDDMIDLDQQLVELVSHLVNFLGHNSSDALQQPFSIFRELDTTRIQKLRAQYKLNRRKINEIIVAYEQNGYAFIDEASWIIVADPTLNILSQVGGEYLQKALCPVKEIENLDSSDLFLCRVLKQAAGTLSSKVLNPRRKFRDLNFYKSFLAEAPKKRLVGDSKKYRVIAKALLKFENRMAEVAKIDNPDLTSLYKQLEHMDQQHRHLLSEALGTSLAITLSEQLLEGKISLEFVKSLYTEAPLDKISREYYMLKAYRCFTL